MLVRVAQDVHFADNNSTSTDSTIGSGGALYVSPDCDGGFGCKNVSVNITEFAMFGNAASQVCRLWLTWNRGSDQRYARGNVTCDSAMQHRLLRSECAELQATLDCGSPHMQAGGALFYDTTAGGAATLVVTSGNISMNTVLSGGFGGAVRRPNKIGCRKFNYCKRLIPPCE